MLQVVYLLLGTYVSYTSSRPLSLDKVLLVLCLFFGRLLGVNFRSVMSFMMSDNCCVLVSVTQTTLVIQLNRIIWLKLKWY